ncbi:hypothetical protein D3C77_725560 [compost metagenome]
MFPEIGSECSRVCDVLTVSAPFAYELYAVTQHIGLQDLVDIEDLNAIVMDRRG